VRIGSSLPLLPTPVSDRGYGAGSRARQTTTTQDVLEQAPREVTRIRSRTANSGGAQTAANAFANENLSSRSRGALQSYLANGPSLSERLGVELAGIDVLV